MGKGFYKGKSLKSIQKNKLEKETASFQVYFKWSNVQCKTLDNQHPFSILFHGKDTKIPMKKLRWLKNSVLTSQTHSVLISSDSMLFITWFSLKQRCLALIFDRFRKTKFGYFFNFFRNFRSTSISRHMIFIFSPIWEKKWTTKIWRFNFFFRAKCIRNMKFSKTHLTKWICS